MSDLEDAGVEDPQGSAVGAPAAGETGLAVDVGSAAQDAGLAQVIVGELPDAGDPSHLQWTARCSVPRHGLLGTFEKRDEAERAKQQHLLSAHGQPVLQ
jgi:hypothetical protein